MHTQFPSKILIFLFNGKKQVKVMWSLSETQLLLFLIVVQKSKLLFWNSETKLKKIHVFCKKILFL